MLLELVFLQKRSSLHGPKLAGEVKKAFWARRRIYRMCRNVQSPFIAHLMSSADDRLKKAIDNAQRKHKMTIADYSNSNPKLFWNAVRA